MMNLMVTARLPGTEAMSNGSSLILRTMRPNALLTASSGPETWRMRSGLPGIDSDTLTRAPDFSRISLTCLPALPMMTDASCVTIRQRIWICCVT